MTKQIKSYLWTKPVSYFFSLQLSNAACIIF